MGGDGKRKGEGGDRGGRKKGKYVQKGGGGGGGPFSDKAVPLGSTGIVVTCDQGREIRAAEEVIRLIEEYLETLGTGASKAGGDKKEEKKDIASLLAAEVADLKDRRKKRFRWHDTHIKGVVYIEWPADDPSVPPPLQVVTHLVSKSKELQQVRVRYSSRLLPVTHTCFASLEAITELAKTVAREFFPDGGQGPGVEFAVEYEHRASDQFDRLEVINKFVEPIPKPPNKVNLSKPEKTLVVQIMRNVCAVGLATQYKELFKFNMRKAGEPPQDATADKKPAVAAAAAAAAGEKDE